MIEIKLKNSNWFFDQNGPIADPGGFGQVFEGKSNTDDRVAIKKLKVEAEEAGHRELKLADNLSDLKFKFVIQIYDYGIDIESGGYFIVMEKAEYSLQDYLSDNSVSEIEATNILKDISKGLKELEGIVHRDIKPANILYSNGKWKIADFGIARFVEESTSINTLKGCLSPYYAAPEQWKFERATKATDIYALGIIAYRIVSGNLPFSSYESLKEMHLNSQPPPLENIDSLLKQIILSCLRKSPESRPSVDSILKQLNNVRRNQGVSSKISKAGAEVAERIANEEAKKIRTQTREEKRKSLANDAFDSFRFIMNELFQGIKREAPVAKMYSDQIELGNGHLAVAEKFKYIPENSFPESKMDIVCGGIIQVTQKSRHYLGRASNLWYIKRGENYRWIEIAYRSLSYQDRELEPFAIESENEFEDVDYAASSTIHTIRHAFSPKIIDGEYMDEFILRWSERLASASTNNLGRPMKLPED